MGIIINPTTGQLDFTGSGGGGGGPTVATRYVEIFNASTDWGTPSGGEYSITILATTHGKGLNPTAQIFEDVAGVLEKVEPNSITVDSLGNLTITVLETPDTRFAGELVII